MGVGRRPYPFRLKAKARETGEWLDKVLADWLDARDSDSEEDLEWDPEDPANILVRPERSWLQYSLCAAFEWRHLPREGGLDDQEEIFLHDAGIIARRLSQLRTVRKINKERREEAERRLGRSGRWPRLRKR